MADQSADEAAWAAKITRDDRACLIAARAQELCRLPDGSPCSGPDTDCNEDNCNAMKKAAHEVDGYRFADDPTLRVRLWWWLTCALAPLLRIGISRPYGWAHVRWLRAHAAMVEDRVSRFLA